MMNKSFCAIIYLTLAILKTISGLTPDYYTAAVFEFVQTQSCTSDPEVAKQVIEFNLDAYVEAAKLAKSKGADVIVYPEYGISPECTRSQTPLFCEVIPNPYKERVNPCEQQEKFQGRQQLITLSCMARNNSMVVQGNFVEIDYCKGDPDCPPAGHWQYNTNVVFDSDGTLLVRYRKEHLWLEYHLDLPKEKQNPFFKTEFGSFLSYVCFDVILERIIEEEMWDDVDGILFSTMWENTMPFGMTVQFFQAWAMTNNLTFIAADINLPGQLAVGSGIFYKDHGALAYSFNPDGISKLIMARVPRRNKPFIDPEASITAVTKNGTYKFERDGLDVGYDGSQNILPPSQNDYVDNRYHVINMKNYTLVKVTEPSGVINTCNNRMCCTVDYSAENITQNFYVAVFNGTQRSLPPYYWGEEDCFLVRCDPADGRECASYPLQSPDVFHHVNLRANFSTPYIYPTVVSDHFRLVPVTEWDYNKKLQADGYESSINFNSSLGEKLIIVGLKGRTYRYDSPESFF